MISYKENFMLDYSCENYKNNVYMAKVMMALSCRDIVPSYSKVCLIAVSS